MLRPAVDFAASSARGELAWPERAESDAVAIEFFIGRSRGDLHFVVAGCPDCVTAKRVTAEFAGGMSVENADFAAVIKRIRGNQRASGDVFAVHEILCVSCRGSTAWRSTDLFHFTEA